MTDYNIYWGDLHTHHNHHDPSAPPMDRQVEQAEKLILDGRENIDFFAVLSYPFVRYDRNGFSLESVRNRPEFLERWDRFVELVRTHHEPGRLVLFAGYEWHGDRTRYGDHNVIYFDPDNPLLDSRTLPELYDAVRDRKALVIPHHTAYYNRGGRGKDWDVFDEDLSPVMEVFSGHGCSEGPQSELALPSNQSMGPAVGGGSYQDALARGLRVGVIGSNDGFGLPGRWNAGRAAVLATELTRQGIWDALTARRCYAVTGDRIELDFSIAGAPMGSVVRAGGAVDAAVSVTGSNVIDRIELVRNNVVAETYCHAGRWERGRGEQRRFKVLIQAGWGPGSHYGFDGDDQDWLPGLTVAGGRIVGIERCFSYPGQAIVAQDQTSCRWRLLTQRRYSPHVRACIQGVVFEIEGTPQTRLHVAERDVAAEMTIAELFAGAQLVPLTAECKARIKERFGLAEADLDNQDLFHQNARKIKLHPAAPESAYKVSHTFRAVDLEDGQNSFYVRISQMNGQMAWSSPIWVRPE